jgi:DNA-3-methyladenine glycosylase
MGRADALKPSPHKGGHPPLSRAELPVDTVSLARYLIGKILVREMAEGVASGLVETEAYVVGDAAGHAYRGMTPRNRSLFLERGHTYVYLVYGSAYMLNVSSEIAGMGLGSSSGRLSRATAYRSCSEIVKLNGFATWREAQEDSPRHCGLILGSMGSIFAEKALYGSDAVITNPTKSGRASGSASRGMRTGSCDFIFGAVRSSAVQDEPEHPSRSAPGSGERSSGRTKV